MGPGKSRMGSMAGWGSGVGGDSVRVGLCSVLGFVGFKIMSFKT